MRPPLYNNICNNTLNNRATSRPETQLTKVMPLTNNNNENDNFEKQRIIGYN